jgi:transposase-like protein
LSEAEGHWRAFRDSRVRFGLIHCGIKRRTWGASILPNTASCLRLVSALLAECDEDWMTGKIYLNLKDGDFHPDRIIWKLLQKKVALSTV